MSKFARLLPALTWVAVGTAGCSKSGGFPGPREAVYPVSGHVLVKGTPASEARVYAKAVGRGITFEAMTDSDGRYQFTTYDHNDGLWPGNYAINIKWPEIVNTTEQSTEIDQLKGRYNNPMIPAFTVEVKAGVNELPPFNLQ